jgi:putative hydroxymethylpyrimidine transport system substrate-binding protein
LFRGSNSLRTAALALAVAAATVLAGCGEKSEDIQATGAEPFTLALDWVVNPDHAGIYTALDRGYFEEAGLSVEPQVPSDPSAPIKQVAAGRADLAVSYEPEVLLAREQGLPVKAVAAMVDEPLTSLIWLRESGIKDVNDLRGKRIATAGIPYQDAYLDAILEDAGLSRNDVEVVNVQQGLLPAILSGRVDAILGGFRNIEGVDLKLRGKDPTILPMDELGIPTYDELVLVANSDTLDAKEEELRLFIAALYRGTQAAAVDPAAATRTILDAGRGLDPKITAAETKATLPLLLPGGHAHSYGYMDPDRWQRFAQFFADNSLIETRPSTDDVLTNDLLPGAIP